MTGARLLPLAVAVVSIFALSLATSAAAASAGTAVAGASPAGLRPAAVRQAGASLVASRPFQAQTLAATQQWHIVARSSSALTTVIAPDATSAWALGVVGKPGGSTLGPAGEHWNGHQWTAAAFPKGVASGIGCAGASSPGNVWAFAGASVFGYGAGYAGALHLVGGKWTVSKAFTPSGLVSGCSVLGRGNAWVYGLTHVAPGVGTWRLTGRTWKPVRHTSNFYLVSASTVSADDVWAIAAGPAGLNNVVAHWNGHAWSRNKALGAVLPPPSASVTPSVTAINAVGAGNVWISAEVTKQSHGVPTTTLLVLHLSGGKWRKVGPSNPGYYLPAAVSDGHGGWWAPGPPGPLPPAAPPVGPMYLLHETGGHWRHVFLPVVSGAVLQVTGIVHVPGSTAMLAIGQLFGGTPTLRSVVLAYGRLPG
ncbi:MAG: hypothetical protein ACLQFR_11575 [Streptosporangiaceae bacterium]